MIGFSINGTFLQLAANSVAQVRRSNPFLNTEAINGEYSLPLTAIYTEENFTALSGYFSFYTPKQKLRIPNVDLYDGTAFAYKGTLVIEELESNLNNSRSGRITGYFLTGISDFFTNVKDKLLKEMDWGGEIEYEFTTFDRNDGSGGFWQHIHATWDDDTIPYVFYPIRNEGWDGGRNVYEWQNKLTDSVTVLELAQADNYYSLCPHIRLPWMLRKLMSNYGYTLTGEVLDDDDFKLLTVPTFQAIEWHSIFGVFTNIKWDLKDHVPPTMKVTELIVNLYQLLGIMFIFDNANKVVRLRALKNLKSGTKKDWTAYAEASFKSQFNSDEHVYAFRNSIDSADSFPGSAPDLSKAQLLPAVEAIEDLPTPSISYVDRIVYVYNHNQWLQCVFDTGVYYWTPYGYNLHSYEPAKSTDSFETTISTMPVINTVAQVPGGGSFVYRLIPTCNQEGNWHKKNGDFKPWGMRLLFYRGRTADVQSSFGPGVPPVPATLRYPYATPNIYGLDHDNDPQGNWALSYTYVWDGVDKGIIAHWWKDWLEVLKKEEIIPMRIWLPKHELVGHQWDDVILIRNVPFVVKEMDVVLPYPGYVDCELRRIG